jgi:hypothetical protein
MTSPGTSSVNVAQYSISAGMSKIRSSSRACCTAVPLRRVVSVLLRMSPTSSGVMSHGPNPPVAGKFLPGVNCVEWRWKSRTEPSL